MKRILALALICAVLFSNTAFAQTKATEVTGNTQSSIINVNIPTSATFTINPNGKTPETRFIAPDLKIQNNSTMPVTISLSKLDNKTGSSNMFTEVGAADKVWAELGVTNSAKFIYLALAAKNNAEAGYMTGKTWGAEKSAVAVKAGTIECASIVPNGEITLNFKCEHGRAFESAIQTTYDLTFIVSVMQ